MRIDWLTLTFGCFDGHRLDLAADGVHIVVGPNEAGKSTVRHAFGQFLYGIDVRTTYDFAVQNMSDLWIKGRVRSASGEALDVVRLKKNKDDLLELAGDGEPAGPVATGAFARFLGGIERAEYLAGFAIDHEELVRGGRDLLDGKGDASRALFEASSGARLGKVLSRLNAQLDEIYKQRASLPRLNAALGRHRALQTEQNSATLNVRDYERLRAAVDKAAKELQRIEEDLLRERAEQSRLQRIQQALPGLAKHAQLSADRAAVLAGGVLAGPATGAELAELVAMRRAAEESFGRAEARSARIAEELAGLVVDAVLLEQGEAIDALFAQSAAVADAEAAGEKARAEAAGLRREIAGLAGGLATEVAAGLPAELTGGVEDLRRAKTELDAEVRGAQAQVARRVAARGKLASAQAADAAAPDVAAIRALIKTVPAGLADRIATLRADVAAEEAKAARVRERGGLPAGIQERPLPTGEQVAEHRKRLDLAAAKLENARGFVQDVEDALDQKRRDLATLLRTDAPPTEEELQDARRARDAAWVRVRELLAGAEGAGAESVGGEGAGGAADASLVAEAEAAERVRAYEASRTAADDIVDRIRREADRSARRLRLEVDIEADVAELDRKRAEETERDRRHAELVAEWATLWLPGGLPAPEPAAAPAVLDACAKLREHADTLVRLTADLDAAEAQAEQVSARLRAALPAAPADAGLTELLALAEEERDAREAARRKREKAEEKLAAASDELALAEADLADCRARAEEWSRQWAAMLAAHDLEGDPDEVLAVLTAAAEIARLTAAAGAADAEAAAAERRVAEFDAALTAVVAACAESTPDAAMPGSAAPGAGPGAAVEPAAAAPPADGAVIAAPDRATIIATLHRRLESHRRTHTQHTELTRHLADSRTEAAEAAASSAAAATAIAALLAAFDLPDLPALEAAVHRTAAVADLDAQLAAVAQALDGTGRTLPALQAEAAEWEADPDRLAAAAAGAASHVAAREAEHTEQVRVVAELRQELRAMDGSARAAEASERAAAELSTVVEESEEYLRLFLARKVLLDCMEEYRVANQGPVLARAEAAFRALTAGRFDRLVADADDKGRFQLLARRAGGERVGVEAMSEGTRDQLYLALRLASLDRYAAAGRAMPLLLDDVFMTFDDARAAAGLGVLDDLADRFQVVLFTHHPHLAALARQALPAERVHVHELPDRPEPGPAPEPATAATVPAQHGAPAAASAGG